MKNLKIILSVLLSVSILFLSGCWNYREIDKMLIIAGMGIDVGRDGKGYHITFDTIDMTGGRIKNSKSSMESKTIESDGDTLFDAIRNVIRVSGKRLTANDMKIVVISPEIARSGILPIIDYFNRDAEFSRSIDFFVSKEKTASEIIKSKPISSTINSYEIHDMITADKKSLAKEPLSRLYEVNNMLGGEGISLITPAITLSQNNNDTSELSGTAVFKKDKLLGFLESDESKYLMFIKGKVKRGVLVLDKSDGIQDITLEIFKSKTDLKPEMLNGKVNMKINIQVEATLDENGSNVDYSKQNDFEKLEKMGEQTIKNHIVQIITKVQKEYDSDIFGFGSTIYRQEYETWNELKPNWDEEFKTLQYEINVKVRITNSAILAKKIRMQD